MKEWLLEIAKHTTGFHVVEQRGNGRLFSFTYGKSAPPIDGNTIVISTLDRVAEHPFVRQAAWDFVVIDECLAVQNAAAKRCPSAWRQIEVSMCGALLLSATFFRSSFHNLFYMIRMLRSPLPRTLEYLPSLIHEHIVCEVPDTNRTWEMVGAATPLGAAGVAEYRKKINAWERDGLNRGDPNALKLHGDLKVLLMGELWEGRNAQKRYGTTSPLAEAVAKATKSLVDAGGGRSSSRRPRTSGTTFATCSANKAIVAIEWSKVNPTTRKGERTERPKLRCDRSDDGGRGAGGEHAARRRRDRLPADPWRQARADEGARRPAGADDDGAAAARRLRGRHRRGGRVLEHLPRRHLLPPVPRAEGEPAATSRSRATCGRSRGARQGREAEAAGEGGRTTPGEKNEKTQGAVEKAWRASLAQMSGSGVIAGGGAAEARGRGGCRRGRRRQRRRAERERARREATALWRPARRARARARRRRSTTTRMATATAPARAARSRRSTTRW